MSSSGPSVSVTLIRQNLALTYNIVTDKPFQPDKSNTAVIDTHYSETSHTCGAWAP